MLKLLAISFALVFCLYVILQPMTSKAWEFEQFAYYTDSDYRLDGLRVTINNDNQRNTFIASDMPNGADSNYMSTYGSLSITRLYDDADVHSGYGLRSIVDDTANLSINFGGVPIMYGITDWENAFTSVTFDRGSESTGCVVSCRLKFSARTTDGETEMYAYFNETYNKPTSEFSTDECLRQFINGSYAEDTPIVEGEIYYIDSLDVTYTSNTANNPFVYIEAYKPLARYNMSYSITSTIVSEDVQNAYDNGYSDGSRDGRAEGFEAGAGFNSINWLLRVGDAIMGFELIPQAHITVGMIIGVSLGVPLLIWFLKLFAGG